MLLFSAEGMFSHAFHAAALSLLPPSQLHTAQQQALSH